MEGTPSKHEPPFFRRWFFMTTLGWLLGFVLVIAMASAIEVVGGNFQFIVGVGMGAGVGLLQSRVLAQKLNAPKQWIWASAIGMGGAFLLWDVAAMAGVEEAFSLSVCVAIGGPVVGFAQSQLLKHGYDKTHWWILASFLGWGSPAGLVLLGESQLLGRVGGIMVVSTLFLGGTLLGAVTGKALLWLPERPTSSAVG